MDRSSLRVNSRNSILVPAWNPYRSMVVELSKREVLGRYRGALLGVVWSVLAPFVMLGVYSIAFGHILKSRWPGVDSTSEFVLIIFVGLITHGFLAECLNRAPMLVTSNPAYVKRVVFPLEILPWPLVIASAFHFLANLLVLAIGLLVVHGAIPLTFLLAPLVFLPMAIVALGFAWWLGALSVYFRDIGQMMPVVTTAMLFISSTIMPVGLVPTQYQIYFKMNPITLIVDQLRIVTLQGGLPDWTALAVYCALAIVFALSGFAWFQKARTGFADVL